MNQLTTFLYIKITNKNLRNFTCFIKTVNKGEKIEISRNLLIIWNYGLQSVTFCTTLLLFFLFFYLPLRRMIENKKRKDSTKGDNL